MMPKQEKFFLSIKTVDLADNNTQEREVFASDRDLANAYAQAGDVFADVNMADDNLYSGQVFPIDNYVFENRRSCKNS